MSLVNDEDATRSWESAVDMEAAMIAASRIPAIKGTKSLRESITNIISLPGNDLRLR